MNFWVVLWRLFLHVIQNVPRSDLLWHLSWNSCMIDKVKLSLQARDSRDLVSFVQYQLPSVSNSCWIRLDLAFRFVFYFPTTVLFMSEKAWSKIKLFEFRRLQNVPFVSLKMICKTLIWCNQILIMKHLWSVVWKTSTMIFLMEYS